MALTRDSRETVQARVERDPAFREGILRDTFESFLNGRFALGNELLQDYLKAMMGLRERRGLTRFSRRP
jgi:hypothetical protein